VNDPASDDQFAKEEGPLKCRDRWTPILGDCHTTTAGLEAMSGRMPQLAAGN
jgi:hypothetical protein